MISIVFQGRYNGTKDTFVYYLSKSRFTGRYTDDILIDRLIGRLKDIWRLKDRPIIKHYDSYRKKLTNRHTDIKRI